MSRKGRERPGKRFKLVFIPLFIVVFLDQLIKNLIKNNVLPISWTTNTGSAFGLLKGFNLGLIFVSIIFIGLVVYLYDRIPRIRMLFVSVGIILGGVVGNLIDRIWLGHVIDFIDLKFWPSFNIADSFIMIGALIFLWFYLKFEHEEYLRLHKK